jgi:hypothetical protein
MAMPPLHRTFTFELVKLPFNESSETLVVMAKSPRKKTAMSDAHKAALAKGREEGRVVRRYLEALESTKPRRGRKRTPDSIAKRLKTIDDRLVDADALSRLHLVQEKQQLESELAHTGDTVDLGALEKEFTKVARAYGDRKGITYSAWRTVGVSAPVLQQAKIARTRG